MNVKTQLSNHIQSDLWQRDIDHVLHPYANLNKFRNEGSVIYSRGRDHYIWDDQGNAYLDGIAGLWCVNIGHGRQDIAQLMAEQSSQLAYYNTFEDASSGPMVNLASKLADLSPGTLNHVFFGTGGSMANDTAIKLVHYYFNRLGKPNKKMILSRKLAYHGSTYLAHALTGIERTHVGFDLPKHIVKYLSAPYHYRQGSGLCEQAFADQLIQEFKDTIYEVGADQIACFIAEPIMGAGGVIPPPADYLQRIFGLCKENDILFISDEVVTAFGRLGEMISSEAVFGIQPDLLVLAKGISSGYIPLSATVFTDEIFEVITEPNPNYHYFSHGFTYSGHALACAVGLKNIEVLEAEGFCEHVNIWGPYFSERLATLYHECDMVGDVRGMHYMQAIELVQDRTSKSLFPDEQAIGRSVYLQAKKRGLIVRPLGNLLVLSPPLTYDQEAIDQTVAILQESIEFVQKN